MPFYIDDFVSSPWVQSALRRQPELVAWYVMLLLHQWKHGSVPLDTDERADICGTDASRMRTHWPALQRRFKRTPKGWVNARLEEVRGEQLALNEARRASATKAAKARWQRTEDAPRMRTHSEGNASGMRTYANKKLEVEVEEESTSTEEPPGVELRDVQHHPPLRHKTQRRYTPEFERLWKTHPRGSKADAADQYDRAIKSGVTAETVLACLEKYVAAEVRPDFRGVHLLRWLRDGRWDEYLTDSNGDGPHGNGVRKQPAERAVGRLGRNQGEFILEG